jgi:serine/threonine protein kinase
LTRRYRDDRFGFVTHVGIQAARALVVAHRREVLHRDIKPSNLMLDADGHVYLVDFGLVRLLDSGEGSQSYVIRGTPWYMSPEHTRAEPLDVRADIYSLGVTLYELTTGGIGPFSAPRGDHERVFEEVRAGRARPLHEIRPDVPEKLRRVIERAMAADRAARYQSAGAMLADLEAPEPAAPGDRPSTRTFHKPATRRRIRAALLTTAALAVAVFGAVWVVPWLARTRTPATTPVNADRGVAMAEALFGKDNPLPPGRFDRRFGEKLSLLTTRNTPV